MYKIAVIGAGASGMMAAITAASAGASVTLYERNDQVGKKILMTGNGKCNFTNTVMNEGCFYGSAKDRGLVSSVLKLFDEKKTVQFFEELGIMPRIRYGGYYPYSEQASAIRDVLLMKLRDEHVRLITGHQVRSIKKEKQGFTVDGDYYDSVILATGGKAAPKSGSTGDGYYLAEKLGIHSIEPLPALTFLTAHEKWFKTVAGVRAEASLKLLCDGKESGTSRGELQLTEQGISGICTFQLSGPAGRMLKEGHKVKVLLNFLPDFSFEETLDLLKKRQNLSAEKCTSEFLIGLFPEKMIRVLIKEAGLKSDTALKDVSDTELKRLAGTINSMTVNVKGTGGFDRCQVTSGGIASDQLSDEMEVRSTPGLYIAGELADCDGICGGYNLQWAWSSGYAAGIAAAGKSRKG